MISLNEMMFWEHAILACWCILFVVVSLIKGIQHEWYFPFVVFIWIFSGIYFFWVINLFIREMKKEE